MSRARLRVCLALILTSALLNLATGLIIVWPYIGRLESWLNGRP